MRAITVRQPWAWAIIHGGKDVENRSRNIAGSYRGPVAIHAGKRMDSGGLADAARLAGHSASSLIGLMTEAPLGAIIGVADLVDVHLVKRSNGLSNVCFDDHTPVGATCSPWSQNYIDFPAERGYHLVLANPRPLAVPIPCRGRLGLWTVPDDIAAALDGGEGE